jgi:hypothetical protein
MSSAFTDALQENTRLREQLVQYEVKLLHKDLEIADRQRQPAPDPFPLRHAREIAERDLATPEFLEEMRKAAWADTPFKFGQKTWEGWPEGVTAESYVRKWHGLTPAGDALLGQAQPIEPEAPTRTFIDDIRDGTLKVPSD